MEATANHNKMTCLPYMLHVHIVTLKNYRAQLKDGPQVVWMLQARSGRSAKQEQEQNSPNMGSAFWQLLQTPGNPGERWSSVLTQCRGRPWRPADKTLSGKRGRSGKRRERSRGKFDAFSVSPSLVSLSPCVTAAANLSVLWGQPETTNSDGRSLFLSIKEGDVNLLWTLSERL